MIKYAQKDLKTISEFIAEVNDNNYSQAINLLSGASIGQHMRHILEFYFAVLDSLTTGIVCYDKRERNIKIEQERNFAISKINETINSLNKLSPKNAIILQANYNTISEKTIEIKSSINRELGYCIEHSIHHQALIKIGIKILQPNLAIHKNFGIAPATVRYRKEMLCAQ